MFDNLFGNLSVAYCTMCAEVCKLKKLHISDLYSGEFRIRRGDIASDKKQRKEQFRNKTLQQMNASFFGSCLRRSVGSIDSSWINSRKNASRKVVKVVKRWDHSAKNRNVVCNELMIRDRMKNEDRRTFLKNWNLNKVCTKTIVTNTKHGTRKISATCSTVSWLYLNTALRLYLPTYNYLVQSSAKRLPLLLNW